MKLNYYINKQLENKNKQLTDKEKNFKNLKMLRKVKDQKYHLSVLFTKNIIVCAYSMPICSELVIEKNVRISEQGSQQTYPHQYALLD